VDKRGSLEEHVRQAIAQRTLEHGRRADISRLIGQQRGWATEYVTGKIKNITLDELAQIAVLLDLDLAALLDPTAAVPAGLPAEKVETAMQLLTLWPSVPEVIGQATLKFLKSVVAHEHERRTLALDQQTKRTRRAKGPGTPKRRASAV